MHYAHTAIYGPSGHGKSTSIRHLDPSEVVIVNTECKQLPFPTAQEYEQIWVQGYQSDKDHADPKLNFNAAMRAATEMKRKVIVIDSFLSFSEILEDWCRRRYEHDRNKFKSYDEYNRILWSTLRAARKIEDTVIVWLGIDELDESEGMSKIKLAGKKMRGAIEKEFLSVFYCHIRKTDEGKQYGFWTQGTEGFVAKTPDGMFDEEYIPNDLKFVIDRTIAYHERCSATTASPKDA